MVRILVVTQERPTGLNYHRQLIPHAHLERNYVDDFAIDISFDINTVSHEKLQSYQIVTFLRLVSESFDSEKIIQRCKDAGCITIIDIDDYWELHKLHELNEAYKEYKIGEQTVAGLINVDYITTTTEMFADKIKEFNKNVIVIPNSIDPFEKQFERIDYVSERMRFGWIGGIFHTPDIRLMYEGFKEVFKTDNSKFQLCLGGFGDNEQYKFIEKIYTNNYKNIKDKNYLTYLKQYRKEYNEQAESQPYKRLWGTDVFNYAKLYNEIDISLVPLVSNNFNKYKSQIKIIEAGYFKKSVIVSNVAPYTIDCNKLNSILISPSKNNEGWGTAMKSLILNPNKADDLKENLHELVKSKYMMDTVNVTRSQLYKRITE